MGIRVVIADSNELIRLGLRAAIVRQDGLELVDEVTNRNELKDAVVRFEPDVVLIDYSCPAFTIDCVPEILQHNRKVRFVAITQNQSALSIVNAIRSGISSYVKKDCDLGEIIDSVRETAKGNKFFCGTILEMIRQEEINIEDIPNDMLTCAPVTITEREIEIITLIAEGYTNQQIAEKLFLSAHTVNTHRKNIMAKLGIANTAGIVMYAVKSHLVSPNKYLFSAQ
ncbi:MAG: response regulator transcription factor [Flavobacteriales bacterium]|nr:response regulator transcription factor [Flavobacteriales bacterium]